jgi:hypothetical protein
MTGAYDLLRGLHIIAVIAWMAGLMMLPRLFAYHTETAPPGSEFDAHFLRWEGKVLKIILTPAMVLTWTFGLALVYVDSQIRGVRFLWGRPSREDGQILAHDERAAVPGGDCDGHRGYNRIRQPLALCAILDPERGLWFRSLTRLSGRAPPFSGLPAISDARNGPAPT